MKSKDLQPRLIYSAKLSFKIEGEIRSFPDKKILKEVFNTKPVVQKENVKGLALRRRRKRERKKNTGKQYNNKMALHMYLSIITLNINGLNVPTKRHSGS